MPHKVLARKWRPKNFDEVFGQKHVITSLKNALKNRHLAHAYLLTGTRGVGKTTVARLLAKSLRCLFPLESGEFCGQCAACKEFAEELEVNSSIDVVEIDGASHNSVENVREIISQLQFLPTMGDYKVYIIDEVHMLSLSAFNALLKTLEAPPDHVKFILATTEPEKLPSTVLSRCQRFDFREASLEQLEDYIVFLGEKEGIRFEDSEVIKTVAKEGRGSLRDTASLLDQILCFTLDKFISHEVLSLSLGLARVESVEKLVKYMLEGKSKKLSELYRNMLRENIRIKTLYSSLLDKFYHLALSNEQLDRYELIWIYQTLSQDSTWVFQSLSPENTVEILFQKICLRKSFFNKQIDSQIDSQEVTFRSESEDFEKLKDKSAEEEPEITIRIKEDELKKKTEKVYEWSHFLKFVHKCSPTMAANLEQGNLIQDIDYSKDKLKVELGFDEESRIFYEHILEKENDFRLRRYLCEFFELEENKIELTIKLLDHSLKAQVNFVSQAEIKEKEIQELLDQKKMNFMEHPLIKEAESLFGSQIDKVIINP